MLKITKEGLQMKKNYEAVALEIVLLPEDDVITTSTPFNGVDDEVTDYFTW